MPPKKVSTREPSVQHEFTTSARLRTATRVALSCLVFLFLLQSTTIMETVQDATNLGLEVLQLPISARLAEALIAVLSVALVTLVYTLLIRRGSLMATTTLYPRRPIETNIGSLLDAAWPESSLDTKAPASGRRIRLFYIGKMDDDESAERVARGRLESIAVPTGPEQHRALWITSGSMLAKNVIQLLIWEWASLWLTVLVIIGTLLFNGFFTNNINPDGYPRLTVMLIYLAAYVAHFSYVWLTCLKFFRTVSGGAAWSLLERAKFVVADSEKIQGHGVGTRFDFRSIDKANENYVATVFNASIGSSKLSSPMLSRASTSDVLHKQSSSTSAAGTLVQKNAEEEAESRAALATIESTQKGERTTAVNASTVALDRIMANTMVMMGIALSTGFASWTSTQLSEQTPNNTMSNQIGSLALLASLSLGAAALFTSAMNLDIMYSSFQTILSLKEIKINGLAVDHYRKRRSSNTGSGSPGSGLRSVAFTQSTVPLAEIGLSDFLSGRRDTGWYTLAGLIFLGPAYVLLPHSGDHDRNSVETEFDFVSPLSAGEVLLTTRSTDQHAKRADGASVDPINVCFVPNKNRYGGEVC